MSDALDKVAGVTQMPLFPLPVVLLPNELLPLHIFEPRYRKMIKDVQITNNLFGICYFESEGAEFSKPPIGSVGCVAELREVQPLEDGRSNILTVGVIRCVLEEYAETDEPYLIGEVSYFEDETEDLNVLEPLADEVFALFMRVAKAAHELSGERGKMPEIPQAEPQMLSFLIAAAFNLAPEEKYKLLEIRSTSERLTELREKLKQTVEKIEATAEINKVAKLNGHSNKPIKLD
jgi:ATP-dependent Lon protease